MRDIRGQPLGRFLARTGDGDPHRARAAAILAAHPEVRRLIGLEPATKWLVLAVVALQLGTVPFFCGLAGWRFWLAVAAVSGTLQSALVLAVHEVTHNLAFREPWRNRVLAVVANLPVLVPFAHGFKTHHAVHHGQLGRRGVDPDVPTDWEARFTGVPHTKLLWVAGQLLAYAARPVYLAPSAVPANRWFLFNLVACLAFDAVIVWAWGWRPVLYLLGGLAFAGSFHPVAGHFISEHYCPVADDKDQPETFSYYGPLNRIAWNVGYHNEHHDFPSIPWSRLPELRRIAHAFYDPLPTTPSWPGATWQFIASHMSGYNRVVC